VLLEHGQVPHSAVDVGRVVGDVALACGALLVAEALEVVGGCAEQHEALVVQVGCEGRHARDEEPQPDAKLAAVNEERV
jgi:hypothetical protein